MVLIRNHLPGGIWYRGHHWKPNSQCLFCSIGGCWDGSDRNGVGCLWGSGEGWGKKDKWVARKGRDHSFYFVQTHPKTPCSSYFYYHILLLKPSGDLLVKFSTLPSMGRFLLNSGNLYTMGDQPLTRRPVLAHGIPSPSPWVPPQIRKFGVWNGGSALLLPNC